ncbi:hypothetical protein F5884DRAFT_804228 [Xylogone sp. PMI_703]|nr:hypothetical protein F5884DRAFT_804228 [Xylogone sp. PMI_703]
MLTISILNSLFICDIGRYGFIILGVYSRDCFFVLYTIIILSANLIFIETNSHLSNTHVQLIYLIQL